MQIKPTIISVLLASTLGVSAQTANNDMQQLYSQAEEQYSQGHFAECQNTARRLLASNSSTMHANGYRLLALCAIEEGNMQAAAKHAQRLLDANPYFSTDSNDPQRFIDIIDELKSAAAGITTASKQAETVEEAPVPVTLITKDMIRHSGTQSLAELLCLYVPGMTMTEGLETNVAMHGTFSLLQDKILVLLDGHRLNSNTTNSEALDFRTSLDKVERIEVLRGPASSLYGNTALTAAVNIITKKGAQINGGQISGTAGTQKTYGGQFVVGGGNNAMDVTAWGAIYSSQGFTHTLANYEGRDVSLYSNGYNGKPSFDLGLKARWNDFSISYNIQHSKKVPYINFMQVPADSHTEVVQTDKGYEYVLVSSKKQVQNFDINQYGKVNGQKPGLGRTNNRLHIDYSHDFENFNLQASAYASLEKSTLYNPIGDSLSNTVAYSFLYALSGKDITLAGATNARGVSAALTWDALTIGGQAQIQTNYHLLGTGTLTAGLQYEHFSITNSTASFINAFGDVKFSSTTGNFFLDGAEMTYSAYAQTKHLFSPNAIMNAGVRLDMHHRQDGRNILLFSPRISLVCKLSQNFSVRAAYSLSNADAPYMYRASTLTILNAGELDPEKMHSIQLSVAYNRPKSPFKAEAVVFYNMINSYIAFSPSKMMDVQSQLLASFFSNVGIMRTIGCEFAATYQKPRFYATANVTAQSINASSDNDIVHNHTTVSTPHCFGNVIVAGAPYVGKGNGFFKGGKLWLRATVSGQSRTWYSTKDWISMAFNIDTDGKPLKGFDNIEWNSVKPHFTLGIGAGYETKWLNIDLSLKNITDNQYNVGSVLTDGIPRAGRQLLGKLTFKF